MRTLGAIVAGTAVALAVLYMALAVVALVVEPGDTPRHLRSFGRLLPSLGAVCLLYFAIASFAAGRASKPRSALGVGAVVTGAACALWLAGGMFAESVLEIWLVALVGAVVLSTSLLLGSEVVYRVGAWGRGAEEA
ncbi:hypothetical protein [Rubrivirga sp. IMCC45206]|uniref:hypothetical protein n=1 Tax=Rubrivirga sp. IMCC45206 TaxID=3391614 RepID=UPI00398FD80F